MFKLLNLNSGAVYMTDKPRYVKRNSRGVWIQCESEDAECIAINGERFSISGKNLVADAPQIISVQSVDFNAQNLEEVKAAIADITDAILDIYFNGL